ncbi:MAG: Pyruvate/ketoisovalerate oxidoreductases common subunit gamma [Promethearchaeota archaeon]|jgi:2-oxoacid:acceptor oxidoreductase gamma subunit (pyruvate/2-ketoisovalerate family)|nr:MAG: Pyruvate/ketoisovalerate oxidoreductases common subunit gamma [Candidatus Lokiarchaeota archaeon]
MTEQENEILKIVIHGRGGQGAVTASQIIVEAAFLSENFADVTAFPSFGAERRGAPIQAYAKLSKNKKIWDRSSIEEPDILIVFDASVLDQQIVASLKPDGIFIVNSNKDPQYFKKIYNLSDRTKIIVADINKLAIENNLLIDGNPIVNTPILGLLAKAIPDLSLENLKKIIKNRMNEELSEINNKLIEEGYKLAKTL